MPIQVWILALAAIAGIIGLAVLVLRRSGAAASGNAELPTEWPLTQRPIFSPEERALYRQLRTALPHHMILAKLPLVRFCQPEDREELRYWFNLLGPIHVSFVVCADNDSATPGNPGLTAAHQAAKAIGARVAYPAFEEVAHV